jgi:hypothetical protein
MLSAMDETEFEDIDLKIKCDKGTQNNSGRKEKRHLAKKVKY